MMMMIGPPEKLNSPGPAQALPSGTPFAMTAAWTRLASVLSWRRTNRFVRPTERALDPRAGIIIRSRIAPRTRPDTGEISSSTWMRPLASATHSSRELVRSCVSGSGESSSWPTTSQTGCSGCSCARCCGSCSFQKRTTPSPQAVVIVSALGHSTAAWIATLCRETV
jgi:hypothetical protein